MRITTLPAAISIVTMLTASPALAGPTVVNCGPGQRAVVSNEFVRGEHVTRIACVGGGSRYRSSQANYAAERRHRTWGQRALVIGGSAGTGAGIGGIVNGGKGALIGGALGGGVASIIEGTRRR